MKPLPYQLAGAKFLAGRKNALLADAPRVGKTAQAIVACDMLLAEKVLWLTTSSARRDHEKAWHGFQQIARSVECVYTSKAAPLAGDVIVTTYDLACGPLLPRLMAMNFDVLVLDESHRLANRTTKRTKAVYGEKCEAGGLVSRALNVYPLSGTPSPNNYAELWPMLRRLAPELIDHGGKPMSYSRFTDRFCKTEDNGFGWRIVGNKNAGELKRRMAPFFMRRTLDDVAPDLPKQRVDTLLVDAHDNLNTLRALERDEMLAPFAKQIERAETEEQRDAILSRIDDQLRMRLSRLTGLAKVPGVVEWIRDEGPEKIVLFAWHHEVIEALFDQLGSHLEVDARVVTGATPPAMRDDMMRAFQTWEKCRVFIGQIQAAGEAIDLSAADEVLFVQSSYVPKDNEQAAARVLNIKKTRPTLARFATLAGSIDERIQSVARRKLEDIRKVFS